MEEQTAQTLPQHSVPVPERNTSSPGDSSNAACTNETPTFQNMYVSEPEIIDIRDLYTVRATAMQNTDPEKYQPAQPFIQRVQLLGPQGEVVRVKVIVDGGAMVSVMCAQLWDKIKHRLGPVRESRRQLRMANGVKVPSVGTWMGTVAWAGVQREAAFEIFPSGGEWSFLLGKPWLEEFGAMHNFQPNVDCITITDGDRQVRVPNERGTTRDTIASAYLTLDVKVAPQALQQPHNHTVEESSCPTTPTSDEPHTDHTTPAADAATEGSSTDAPTQCDLWYIGEDVPQHPELVDNGAEIPELHEGPGHRSIYTRATNPFLNERVEAVVKAVTIGDTVTEEQRHRITGLVREFADCFALSVGEVSPVPGAIHKLDIPANTSFSAV